jgi:peptide/nickel transport system permease protein
VTIAARLGVTSARARRIRLVRVRFFRRPVAVAGLVVVCLFILSAALAPWIVPYSPNETDFNRVLAHPSWSHWLGTDQLGRDLLSRIVFAGRASLLVGFAATGLSMLIAVPIGLCAGYYGGRIDSVIARATDVLLAFPGLIIAVALAAILGPSLRNVTIALALAALGHFIRVTRGEALVLREQDYVKAAVISGAGGRAVIFHHILPNMTSVLIVQGMIHVPVAIVGEAALSFLGLGVRPPTASWGVMLSEGQTFFQLAPRLTLIPGIAVIIIALAFNLLADGLRDALDPKMVR